MDIQLIYQKTIKYAADKHAARDQKIPGTNLPYVVHLSNVTMEIIFAAEHSNAFNLDLAVQVSLLHDILEDTGTTVEELAAAFGTDVAEGVQALTKNDALPKEEKMSDSLNRLKTQPKEVQAVKLADRITNLQAPPAFWELSKIKAYQEEALQILQALNGANTYLEKRLKDRIEAYSVYFEN
ncbi:MAG: metal dependent phosphohydrolase [Cytophagaceae bacterium]|jgi:guanosine-3',5'-bis(diphosphate) 3'-pyrophosphohydrolase|nr:metal dependent phosphohydrolase [Cytophagaceae bacterium]